MDIFHTLPDAGMRNACPPSSSSIVKPLRREADSTTSMPLDRLQLTEEERAEAEMFL